VHHWVDGGETNVDNLVLLCWRHHHLLHEGGYRIRRDYQGDLYFLRADGRAIPRCGYRPDDFTDDESSGDNPSMEGSYSASASDAQPSMEVREPRVAYRLQPSLVSSVQAPARSCNH
jgi:hypothetical protein